ncbi:Globin-like protein [Glarea lozoyensis ATCC 20868]|uniref:nitric oxide dioxygenase n=1 Tax=Glarea lozoyensis (strain ATCC 20868 / MF5171) TaxID=1116229 RepID=S3D2U5_GLAL2|nr:Globin-like protein [Glarea lozoyensis ATCC 20868]EPE32145.1 Globin-like protein [Glarea lozoyensis ATCC 20868]
MSTLTKSQIQTIKATVPVLAQHGETITTKFYADLLVAHPELKNVFNSTHQATGRQARALGASLHAYASNIDDLGRLSPALELICHKHASLYIQPESYDVVGYHLLKAMKEVLGDAATPEILDAWETAYWQLANIMMSKEKDLYQRGDGWTNWKSFRIAKKIKEAEEITSFYLKPVDETFSLPMYKLGQYISVNVHILDSEGGHWQARQYSMSDSPGNEYLRISVKRDSEAHSPDSSHVHQRGQISNLLHDQKDVGDEIQVSHPRGDFYFESQRKDQSPVILISAGVGSTCLLSILKTISQNTTRPITWIHGARNHEMRPFKETVDQICSRNDAMHTVYFSSRPLQTEVEGREYDKQGRINLENVNKWLLFTDDDSAQYFVCGPSEFMVNTSKQLKRYGVNDKNIKMELFGTGAIPDS